MSNKTNLPLILLLLLVLFGCKKDYTIHPPSDPCNNDVDAVYIRVSNSSIYDFTDIVVNSKGTIVNYDNLRSGAISGYKKYDSAFAIASIDLKINDTIDGIRIIDYVGEKPLCNDYYTYELVDNPYPDLYPQLKLGFNFKRD